MLITGHTTLTALQQYLSDYDAPRRNDDEPGADPMEADGAEPRTSPREKPEQPRMAQVNPIQNGR